MRKGSAHIQCAWLRILRSFPQYRTKCPKCAQNARYPPLQKRHSQFDRALENKLGRAGKSDIGETLTVAVKIDI